MCYHKITERDQAPESPERINQPNIFQEVHTMNKNTFTEVKLAKGEMNVYDFGTVKLHAYKTNDFIDNEVFIV